MDRIYSTLQNEKLQALFKKVQQKSNNTVTIRQVIAKAIPTQYHNKYQVSAFENGIITISTSTVWITWIKAFEHDILLATKQNFNVEKIKWQVKPMTNATKTVAAKYKVYISPKSAKVITAAAKNIKQPALKEVLLKIASRTQTKQQ